jgi:putative FmdB family regulatory protein
MRVPIYEYECESCEHRFEVIQKFSDKPLKKCNQCGGPVHRVLSPPALMFKGSGWYVTDYAKPERLKKERQAGGDGNGAKSEAAPSKAGTSSAKSDA